MEVPYLNRPQGDEYPDDGQKEGKTELEIQIDEHATQYGPPAAAAAVTETHLA